MSALLSDEQAELPPDDALWQLLDEQDSWQGEVWYRRRDGQVFPAWQTMGAVRGPRGEPLHYIASFSDISEKKASEQRIQYLAHYDVLTNLPNRILLQDRLQNALWRMQRGNMGLAILFIDLDRFKNINDSLGHAVGDRLLQEVAELLKSTVREEDTVARLGGDEFLIILENLCDLRMAGVVANKILLRMGTPLEVEQHMIYITASIGISLFPDDGDEPEILIKHADTAMYRAKETGRNNFQFYTPELTRLSLERFELERDLRLALERGELELFYQPQARVADGVCIGAEVLVRWQHPSLGLLTPDRFIGLAEETGLIHDIGSWVLRTACQQAVIWQADGRKLRMAVNLSGLQIIHGNIAAQVREVLQETALDPRWLELEITEGFILDNAETGIQVLEQLKELGVTLAIDDFGTGYSSLGYLKRLPLDRLKIDRSFVCDIPEDQDDVAIVTTIIGMARHLQLEVIAEGVESVEQLEFLQGQGCNEYQGFYLGRPMPLEQFEMFMQDCRPRSSALNI